MKVRKKFIEQKLLPVKFKGDNILLNKLESFAIFTQGKLGKSFFQHFAQKQGKS